MSDEYSVSLIFADNGVVIGNRDSHGAVILSYGQMFGVVKQFLDKCYAAGIHTENGKLIFKGIKQGDGSPYPIMAVNLKGIAKQLKCAEIIFVGDNLPKKETPDENNGAGRCAGC